MKILSLQGLLFAVIFYVVIDRALNYTKVGGYSSQATYALGGEKVGISFGQNAIFIVVGALALVYITPRLF